VKRYIQDIKETGRRSKAMRRASKPGNRGELSEFIQWNLMIFMFYFFDLFKS